MNQEHETSGSVMAAQRPGGLGRLARPVQGRVEIRRGVGIGEVALHGGFWGTRQEVNAAATLDHCYGWMERLGWLENFDRVAEARTGGERPGWQFSDSEVYKLMEALAWQYGSTHDAATLARLDELTKRVGRAMDGDGYLNTCFGHAGQAGRYTDMAQGHELYCAGHLLQAGVAACRAIGRHPLVDVARKVADHVCREFGSGGKGGRPPSFIPATVSEVSEADPSLRPAPPHQLICGHPEIETALAEFGRAVGQPMYIDQARLFIERRGHGSLTPPPLLSSAYFQDDMPVRQAEVWRGHAVRALYLASGAVDVATECDDVELLEAVRRQWDHTVARRTYLTGGMGSRHQDEGFGADWELPPDRAYCETCAGIASVMVAWRLFLATGDVRYPDLMERTFFNVIAASPADDGRAFFYANPLQQRVDAHVFNDGAVNSRAEGSTRASWFDVSCCPTNIARTMAAWQTYCASVDADQVTILQYAAARIDVELDGLGRFLCDISTDYPDAGVVIVDVLEAPSTKIELRLRIPAWAEDATLRVGDETARQVGPGWALARRRYVAGDRIVLTLPMAPRYVWPDDRIDAARGCVAVQRGPVVLCAESVDLPEGVALEDVAVSMAADPVCRDDGSVVVPVRIRRHGESTWPYGAPRLTSQLGGSGSDQTDHVAEAPTWLRLTPYYDWAKRGPSTMRVFLPVADPL